MTTATASRLQSASAVPVVLITTLLAGCLTAIGVPEEAGPATGPALTRNVTISAADLGDRPGNLVVTLRVAENVSYNLTIDNNAPVEARGFDGGAWSSCATSQWGRSQDGAPTVDRTRAWAYTQGHALRIKSKYGNATVNHGAAVDDYFGLLNETIKANASADAGTWLRYSIAAEPGSPAFAPRITVSAPKPAFEVVDRSIYDFACAANTEPFDGLVVHSGLPPAPTTLVRNAVANVTTTRATEAYFYATSYPWPTPGPAGVCETSIAFDDRTVNATGPRRECYLGATGPAGQVSFRLEKLAGYSPVVAFFAYDRPRTV